MVAQQGNFLTSNQIRHQFLDFFRSAGHTVVESSSLVPTNDATLLFTNAGMVQFKDVFLGQEHVDYTRAVSIQRCVRAGGKHNDLERVGYTARHHTFFEMLGNFSFGDYFKRDAIKLAWKFLTTVLKLPPERLWVSVFEDDHESKQIWLDEMKVSPQRFSYCGEHDNFWSMGPTGPCGPCTEIFYDHGADIPGGPPGSPEADGDRFIEIWNLVFMQYNRRADGSLAPLKLPSVDTGMGLERIAAVMQAVHNNYDTDLFQPLLKKAAELANVTDLTDFSLHVIADHIRSASFLIADGILPANEGRGYVLRRIIRRALRHGNKIGLNQPFFPQLVPILVNIMQEAYPYLITKRNQIEQILAQEEAQFSVTLTQGLKLFDQVIAELTNNLIPGSTVFKLYDTYGFPVDLTEDIAREHGYLIDYAEFETAMNQQRQRSREAHQFHTEYFDSQVANPTKFTGHENSTPSSSDSTMSTILAIYVEGKFVSSITAKTKASIILDTTPFYAESGGQVGDQGMLRIGEDTKFKVLDTIKQADTHLHIGILETGTLNLNDSVHPQINQTRRAAIVLNHTATHLLHLILKQVLGETALQKGSLVEPQRLRFDFAHPTALTKEELRTIEQLVNQEIRANHTSSVRITTPQEAIARGAVALFGEKYGKKVRMVQFGSSVELCGGTHAEHTGDIGLFKIIAESGVAAGIRRIEAVTGEYALSYIETNAAELHAKLQATENKLLEQSKEITALKTQLANHISRDLSTQAKLIGDISLLTATVTNLDSKALRYTVDQLKHQLGRAIIVLANVKDQKIALVGGVSENLVDRFNARDIVNLIAHQIGGKGGGRKDMAEGGGNRPAALEAAFSSVHKLIQEKVCS